MSKKITADDLFRKHAPPLEDQFFSLGHCCVLLQINPDQLDTLMDAAEVRFTRMQDSVLYVDGVALQAITDVYNSVMDEVDSATAATERN